MKRYINAFGIFPCNFVQVLLGVHIQWKIPLSQRSYKHLRSISLPLFAKNHSSLSNLWRSPCSWPTVRLFNTILRELMEESTGRAFTHFNHNLFFFMQTIFVVTCDKIHTRDLFVKYDCISIPSHNRACRKEELEQKFSQPNVQKNLKLFETWRITRWGGCQKQKNSTRNVKLEYSYSWPYSKLTKNIISQKFVNKN